MAEFAGVHRNTVSRAETSGTEHGHAVAQIARTFEEAGVEFTNHRQPGLRPLTPEAALERFAAYVRGTRPVRDGSRHTTPEKREEMDRRIHAEADKLVAVRDYQEFEQIRDALQKLGVSAPTHIVSGLTLILPERLGADAAPTRR